MSSNKGPGGGFLSSVAGVVEKGAEALASSLRAAEGFLSPVTAAEVEAAAKVADVVDAEAKKIDAAVTTNPPTP